MRNTQYRLNQKEPHLLTLIVMSSFASMGAVIFTPALPEIASFFNISSGHAQLAVTLFLLGYAIGQLFYGPLANRFGRKKAFYVGIVIATMGSILSIVSEPMISFHLLILGRLLEALGSSAGLVISFTIINDHYYPEQTRRIIAYMMLAFAIVPGVATLVGGLLVSSFHWISCFYFLLLYGLALFFPAAKLAETMTVADVEALKHRKIIKNYKLAFLNRRLWSTSLFYGLTSLCIYVYAATAPFIAIQQLKISPAFFGMIGLIPFIGTAVGSVLSGKLSSKLNAMTLIRLGYGIEITATILMTGFFIFHFINLYTLIGCGFVFMLGGCLIMSNAAGLATSEIEDKANGSAVMSFINVGMTVIGTFLLAILPWSAVVKLCVLFIAALLMMAIMKIRFLNQSTKNNKVS